MPTSTVRGFPYPLPSDPLGDADQHMKDLADFLNNFVRGDVTTVNLNNSSSGSQAVVFPTAYAVAPKVVATSSNAHYICGITGLTNTGFTLNIQRRDNTLLTAGVPCFWIAVPT